MAEILLSKHAYNTSSLAHQIGLPDAHISNLSCQKADVVAANTPYLLSDSPSSRHTSYAHQISSPDIAKKLTEFSTEFGDDMLEHMAEITNLLEISAVPIAGASTSVYAGRMAKLGEKIKVYQDLLIQYHHANKTKAPQANALRQQAKMAY